MDHIELGQRIRNIRRSKGITATHVAKKLGYKTVSSYTRYEVGGGKISVLTAKKVADILGVTIEDFFSPEFTRNDKMRENEKGDGSDDQTKAG